MNIRLLEQADIPEVDRIYNAYFSDNEYPAFFNGKYSCRYAVTDDSNKLILAGGVKTIAETVVVTDRSRPVKTRLDALLQALGSSIFITQAMKYNQIHAFVNNDEKYIKVLQTYGFKLVDAKVLILDCGEPNGKA